MGTVDYEVKNKIAYITYNRPEKLNAINMQMFTDLASCWKRFDGDPNALVAIISGKGKAFCAGADLAAEAEEDFAKLGKKVDMLYLDVLSLTKPTIAAVHGFCLAQGMGVFLCCDIRIAAEGAKFGWPQVKRGIVSMSGPALAIHLLPRNFGYEYLLTGELFGTEEASRFFLVNRVVPLDKLMATAEEIANKIIENAPLAVQGMKEASILGLEMNLKERLYVGGLIQARVWKTKDALEGLRAFEQKRKPIWRGE